MVLVMASVWGMESPAVLVTATAGEMTVRWSQATGMDEGRVSVSAMVMRRGMMTPTDSETEMDTETETYND